MSPETFLEKFDLIADALDAVSKMRELVLRLAFSGGLSESSIVWNQSSVEEITTSVTPGFACSKSNQVENGHIHLRTHNISTLGTLNKDLLVKIDPMMVDAKKASIKKGDILFNNTNSQELVGKTCLVDRDYEYGFSNHINRIRLRDDVDPAFVVYYFTLLRNSGYFAGICTRWINQAAVNTDALKKQKIPLPPLAEQKRIVAKVDELMALCDRLEEQQNERDTQHAALSRASLTRFSEAPSTENLNFLFHPTYTTTPADLRKTILTLAVQGKLVPQDPNDEPAEALIASIKAGNKVVKSTSDIPFDIPSSWAWVGATELTESVSDSGKKIKTQDVLETGLFPVVDQGKQFIRGFYNDTKKVIKIDSPVIIFGDHTREIKLINFDFIVGADGVKILKPLKINPYYYVIALLWLPLESRGYGRHFKILKASQIAIPPLAEQKRIVAKVDELMKLVDQLESQLTTARTTAENLLQAILADLTA